MIPPWPPADVVQTLKQRLAGVQIPVLLDSTYFASFLKQDKLNLFPAAAYTERPATACARICEGKIVILVSGSPLAMVVPSFFAEHFECLDDYSSGAVFAGLIRLLKYLAFLLAVFGPGLYVMAVSFAPELIPRAPAGQTGPGRSLHAATAHAGNAGRDPAAGNCA